MTETVRIYADTRSVIAEHTLTEPTWSSVTNSRFASEHEARCWQEIFWPEAEVILE